MLPGGGAMHLVDSLGQSGMDYVCFQHEQGAACAAEAYGQHTNTPGFLLVTSGPGLVRGDHRPAWSGMVVHPVGCAGSHSG